MDILFKLTEEGSTAPFSATGSFAVNQEGLVGKGYLTQERLLLNKFRKLSTTEQVYDNDYVYNSLGVEGIYRFTIKMFEDETENPNIEIIVSGDIEQLTST